MSTHGLRRIESPSGLVAEINANGSLRRLLYGDVVLNLLPGSEVEGGPTNLSLRRPGAAPSWTPLLGPGSPLAFAADAHELRAAGDWEGVRVVLTLRLAGAAPAWFWHVALENRGPEAVTLDLVHAQDVALAAWAAILLRGQVHHAQHHAEHRVRLPGEKGRHRSGRARV